VDTLAIPTGAADLTAEWLTAALGVDGTVTAADASPVGTGQVADSIRLRLTWDPPDAGPPSVVVKVTSSSGTSRAAAIGTRTYEVEVGFYNDLAPSLPVHRPGCWWAGFDAGTIGYAVVLDDMAPAVAGDQLAGCSVDQAVASVDELALLHGARWGDAALRSIPWLDRYGADHAASISGLVGMMVPGFLERYAASLPDDVVALVERYVDLLPATRQDPAPATVVHQDFRNDNLLFGGPSDRVCVVDWQTVALGAGLSDVSYFLGGSLLPEVRAAEEQRVVRHYHERLLAAGDVALSWDDCWTGYRRHAFAGLTMAIIASMLVVRTDRGDQMFVAMAERAGRHALDLETETLLRA
jgi:hypothetical protein